MFQHPHHLDQLTIVRATEYSHAMTFLTFAILNPDVVNESFAQNIFTSLFQLLFIVIPLVKVRKRFGRYTRRTKSFYRTSSDLGVIDV